MAMNQNELITPDSSGFHIDDMDFISPTKDPCSRENPDAFWVGYGKFRQGKWYTDLPRDSHSLAGWFFGFTEGKRWKKWWQSKSLWLATCVGFTSVLAQVDVGVISDNPRIVAFAASTVAAAIATLRFVTHTTVK
jgi:hypothetical protein